MRRPLLPGVLSLALALGSIAHAQTPTVSPVGQTGTFSGTPISSAIWVDPSDVSKSVVYAADGSGALAELNLQGQTLSGGSGTSISNVGALAILYDVPIQGAVHDYLVVSNPTAKTVSFFRIDPASGLPQATTGTFGVLSSSGSSLDKLAVYRSPITGGYYLFVSDQAGNIEQWQLVDTGGGNIGGSPITRTGLALGEQLGGMIGDDANRSIFVTGQNTGLWRFDAEPGSGQLTAVDSTSGALRLVAPIGGLALYRAHGAGYLVVADTGNSDFALYARNPSSFSDYLTRFQIGSGNGLDGVQNPRAISVMSYGLGSAFPNGLFVTDDAVTSQGGPELKYVSWGDVASAASLTTPDTTDNPHTAADGGTTDGGTDGGVTDGGTVDTSRHSGCTAAGGPLSGLLALVLLGVPFLRRRSA